MNPATILLLCLVFGLVLFDVLTHRGRKYRALFMEVAVFLLGAFFIVVPEGATELAHRVGIGRGADFLIYPIVIWLTRESLLNRRRHLEDSARITELTRALALATARSQNGGALGSPALPDPGASVS
jgi:hypothetical protein